MIRIFVCITPWFSCPLHMLSCIRKWILSWYWSFILQSSTQDESLHDVFIVRRFGLFMIDLGPFSVGRYCRSFFHFFLQWNDQWGGTNFSIMMGYWRVWTKGISWWRWMKIIMGSLLGFRFFLQWSNLNWQWGTGNRRWGTSKQWGGAGNWRGWTKSWGAGNSTGGSGALAGFRGWHVQVKTTFIFRLRLRLLIGIERDFHCLLLMTWILYRSWRWYYLKCIRRYMWLRLRNSCSCSANSLQWPGRCTRLFWHIVGIFNCKWLNLEYYMYIFVANEKIY